MQPPPPPEHVQSHVSDDQQGARAMEGTSISEDKEWNSTDPKSIMEELQAEYAEVISSEAQDSLDSAELDALLIYAGLFSAILTAFNVESYRLLQPDPTDSNAAAIRELAAELRAFALNDRSQNVRLTPPLRADAPSSFNPPSFVVWINCLWFASLIISLASATIALLVKQWLYEARTGISGQSRASTQLLQYRVHSIEVWKVRGIALLVPLLLQVALLVFLAGLLTLLYNLNIIVAAVSTAFAGSLFVFLAVVTVLPAFFGDCCYRSPQARLVSAAVRPVRNFASRNARHCARFLSYYTERTTGPRRADVSIGLRLSSWLFSTLQKPFTIISRAPLCLRWPEQEQNDLLQWSGTLNVKTAVTAWATTLDPTHLDNMRVALCGEPGAPLVDCLRQLGIDMNGDISLPVALSKRNVSRRLAPIVLTAVRQMLTIDRKERGVRSWEHVVQQLLNIYTFAGMSSPSEGQSTHDAEALRTAFFVLMETKSIENRYAALDYLSTAVDVETDVPCEYKTVSRVFSAAERWIQSLQEDQKHVQAAVGCPQTTLTAFRIIVHCMLRIIEGKTPVPAADRTSLGELYERAAKVLSDLPLFLPAVDALLEGPGPQENQSLCNELAFGLQPLIPLLVRLSRSNHSALHDPPIPEMVSADVVDALHDVWNCANSVLTREAMRSNVEQVLAGFNAGLDVIQDALESMGPGFITLLKSLIPSSGADAMAARDSAGTDVLGGASSSMSGVEALVYESHVEESSVPQGPTEKLNALQADIASFFPTGILGPLPHSS